MRHRFESYTHQLYVAVHAVLLERSLPSSIHPPIGSQVPPAFEYVYMEWPKRAQNLLFDPMSLSSAETFLLSSNNRL